MPIKRMLDDNRTFGPKAVTVLLEAFDGVVAELGLRRRAERERAARIVIQLALGQTDLDATKLRDSAVAAIRNGTRRRRPFQGRRRGFKVSAA
jgi:hypothetical protein